MANNFERCEMDIYEVLKEDHRLVRELLKKLEQTDENSGEERIELLTELKENLLPHSRAEEQVLYEALKDCDVEEAAEKGFEGYEEHAVADHLIQELEATQTEDKRWTALMVVLKENLEHHIEEEEGEFFKKAREAFDDDTAKNMATNFMALKEILSEELNSGDSLEQTPSHSSGT